MELSHFFLIALTVLIASGLTFFSGFGLGTIMLPVFSLFMPLPLAVVATAVVHFANNIFKFAFVYRDIHFSTLLRFGIPAILSAIVGSYLLTHLTKVDIIQTRTFYDLTLNISWIKIIVGILMISFALFDLIPQFSNLLFDKKHLSLGGILSGFFGGLSGHQGAFRAAFLSKSKLTRDQFIATSNSLSLAIDLTRLIVYSAGILEIGTLVSSNSSANDSELRNILIVAILFAFLGTFIGKSLVTKTTFKSIQRVVGIMLIIMGILIGTGIQ